MKQIQDTGYRHENSWKGRRMLTIWGRKNSINVQKVVWCAAELGLDFDRKDAGLQHGFPEGFEEINPNRKVPAISDEDIAGGFFLWESHAIVRYLAAKNGALIPTDLQGRADCERWMDWQHTTVWETLKSIFFGMVRTAPEERDNAAIQTAIDGTAASLGILEDHLSSREYVLGEELSVADIPLAVSAYRWFEMEIDRPNLPNFTAYYEKLKERPAFQEHCMFPLT
ncbi:MAG: glutathione S-transferase family protein [Rubrobacter sp.]